MNKRTPEETYALAFEFIERNPEAWAHMKRRALELARAGRRFSIDQLTIEVRYGMELEGYTDGFRMSNALSPALARILRYELEGVQPYIEVRKSELDKCDIRSQYPAA